MLAAMSDAMAVAASAMRTAENQVSATAERIVRLASVSTSAPVAPVEAAQSAGYQAVHVAMPTAELAEEMANLKQAELGFRAGIAAFRAADRMTQSALDILT